MIVYADMVADLFHVGHLEFLKKCKAIAGQRPLVIGIHNDDDVEQYKRKPVYPMVERARIVRSIKGVDRVLVDAPVIITEEFIDGSGIGLVVHGHVCKHAKEYHKIQQMYAVPIEKGIMCWVDPYPGISTTQIIEKVKNAY